MVYEQGARISKKKVRRVKRPLWKKLVVLSGKTAAGGDMGRFVAQLLVGVTTKKRKRVGTTKDAA